MAKTWIPVANLAVATDETTADLIRNPSETKTAIIGVVIPAAEDAAADYLGTQPGVVAGAEAAVTAAIAGRSLTEYKGYVGTGSLDELLTLGIYRNHLSANATLANGYPIAGAVGTLEVLPTSSTAVQQRFTIAGEGQGFWTRRRSGTTWSPWERYSSTRPTQLGSQNLATVTAVGSYFQNIVGNATTANGYPVTGVAGSLEVVALQATLAYVVQRYTPADGSGFWMRTIAATVSEWIHVGTGGSAPPVDATPKRTWKDEVQGLYERSSYSSLRVLAADPNVPRRVWGYTGSTISYIDNDGLGSPVSAGAPPTAASAVAMLWSSTHVFLVAGSTIALQGEVWRSPKPGASSPSFTWTKVFDLTGYTTTAAGGVNGGAGSYFREQSLCIAPDGSACVLEYGGVITGGPSLYKTANIHAASPVWTKVKQWALGKHGHGVAYINNHWWVMLGDAGFDDAGLWESADAVTWNRASLGAADAGGNTRYGINIFEATIDGHRMLITDSDTRNWESVLYFPTVEPGKKYPLGELVSAPAPYNLGTVRSLTQTSEGNLIWIQIGENNALGPIDSLWMSRAPFTTAVLLEQFASPHPLGSLGAPVESGPYVFFGRNRITKEKFVDQ